jgi:hypothetical protein
MIVAFIDYGLSDEARMVVKETTAKGPVLEFKTFQAQPLHDVMRAVPLGVDRVVMPTSMSTKAWEGVEPVSPNPDVSYTFAFAHDYVVQSIADLAEAQWGKTS